MQILSQSPAQCVEAESMPTRRSVKLGLSMSAETSTMAELENRHRQKSSNNIELPALQRYVHIIIFFVLAISIGIFQDLPSLSSASAITIPNSLYVPGGGISGIFYRFGQLQNIPDEELETETIFCYSAGCLAMLMRRQHWSTGEVISRSKGVRDRWFAGDYGLQDSLKHWIEKILDGIAEDDDLTWMSNMVILTTKVNWNNAVGEVDESSSLDDFLTGDGNSTSFPLGTIGGLTSVANMPKSKQMLRTMLLESAWIPFASGRSLLHERAVDGGFTAMLHPTCARAVKQGVSWSLYANFLNPFISQKMGRCLVTSGKEYVKGIRYN